MAIAHQGGNRPAHGRRRAYSLAEGILGLAIVASFIVGVTRLINYSANTQESRAAATRMSTLSQAADAYIKNFGPNLSFYTAQPGQYVTIPMTDNSADEPEVQSNNPGLPSFQGAGVLGANFQNRNANGQKTALVVFTPANPVGGKSHGFEAFLVNYGGTATPDAILAGAEGMSEGRVGAVLANDPALNADAQGTAARGARGGWVAPATAFAPLAATGLAPSAGHLVSYISLNRNGIEAADDSEYLCRKKTSDASCNTMLTDIDMGGNQLKNVSEITPSGASPLELAGDVNVDGTLTTQKDSNVGGNETVAGNQTVGGDQNVAGSSTTTKDVTTTGGNLVAGATGAEGAAGIPGNGNVVATGNYYSAGSNQYYVNPAGVTNLAQLNVDTKATSTIRPSLDGVPIADLIPSHIVQATVLATDGASITKPICQGAGVAKIFAFPVGQYNASQPQTSIQANVNYTEVTVYTPNGTSTPTTTTVNSINPKTTATDTCDKTTDGLCLTPSTTETESYNLMSASDNGTSWTLNLKTFATDPTIDTTNGEENLTVLPDRTGFRNQALVQTACYYPLSQ